MLVRSFEEFQCNILKYSGTPLSRLNLLTHASPIEFALSGHVTRPTDLAPGECRFGNAVKEADLDALSADMKKKLQACFTKDAEIYIYGCWAGGLPDPGTGSFLMRPELLQKVANTFQVVTDGPDVEIYWFCAFLSGDGHKDSAGTEKDLLERGYSALGNVPVGNAAAVRPAFKDSKKGFRHLTLKTKKAPVKP